MTTPTAHNTDHAAYSATPPAQHFDQQPMGNQQLSYQTPPPQQAYQTPPPMEQSHITPAPHGHAQHSASHGFDGTTPAIGPDAGRGPFQEWHSSFWDCFKPMDVCCMAYWCPCFLFGKTQQRLKDPNLETYESFNGNCVGWCALGYCGFQWVLQMAKRQDMRAQFNLDGSGAGDCFRSYCCPCCGLVQEEKESVFRTQGAGAGAGAPQGYQKNATGMEYGAPAAQGPHGFAPDQKTG
ncbi:MAG: hypothetical protein M1817_002039 [Caeruleum heppii]|nr:MAG: hypothetical protein M1817_002039 [Caeruleum heppii]